MGEEETMSEVAEAVANGTIPPEQKVEDVSEPREEENDGVKEMEEERKDDEKVVMQKMDVDREEEDNKETKEEEKKVEEEEKKEEMISEPMEEEMKAKENEEGEDKVDELKEEEEREEESEQGNGSKPRGKWKRPGIKAKSDRKEVEEKEKQKVPVAFAANRPVRERKSVQRLVESIEEESVKEFIIEKGRGTALKDIPNVAFKLSKRKADDTLKLLHTILFGRRGKAAQVKSNISQFSGIVWTENEEKQKIKVKEKLDKCVKEKLLGFCDVLDIQIAKADTTKTNTRKEDIIVKLIDFLVAPQATTIELLAEKEQSSKGTKRKRVGKQSASLSAGTPSKSSAKGPKTTEKASKDKEKSNTPETDDESDEEEEEEEEEREENGVPERSKNEVPEHSESEENKDEFEGESEEDKRSSRELSARKESAGKAKTKKVATPKKSSPSAKRTPVKSSSNRSKVGDSRDTSPKTFSRKKISEAATEKSSSPKTFSRKKRAKAVEEKSSTPKTISTKKGSEAVTEKSSSPKTFSRKKRPEAVKDKSSTPKKPASVEKTGKKTVKGKTKPKEDKVRPSDDELRNAICGILKEVDFNTATFTDILKQLAGQFNSDLTPRKSSIKLMIQNELTKLADEADDEEEED